MTIKVPYVILVDSLSAYHEALFGEALDLSGEPRPVVESTLKCLQTYVKLLTSTFGGREALRNAGWAVEEVEPALQAIADYNDDIFERDSSINKEDIQ